MAHGLMWPQCTYRQADRWGQTSVCPWVSLCVHGAPGLLGDPASLPRQGLVPPNPHAGDGPSCATVKESHGGGCGMTWRDNFGKV